MNPIYFIPISGIIALVFVYIKNKWVTSNDVGSEKMERIAKNISDAEAEATFIAMMNAIHPDKMKDEKIRTQAVWLIDGYKPTDAAIGVFEAAKMSTTPYPMLPYMGLLHTALGNELADFMQGKESASQALSDVEAAYTAAAKEKGFLN